MSLLDYASLYDRFGGDNPTSYPLDPSAKRRLFKQGLLEFAAAMSKPNGGNFANSLATGLLSAKQAGQQGADQYVNDAYRGDIMQRTRDEMAAKTRLEQAKASVVGPDGQIDETRFRQYATLDPTGAKALRDALQPQVKRDFHAFDTGNGTVPIFTDDAGNMYDVNGQKVDFGGQPQAAPAQSMPPSVLHAAVEQQESGGNPFAVSPAGAMGPMQTMPMTLRDPGYGVAPAKDGSVDEQRRVGQQYLDALTAKYGLDGGLAAYNWGPGNWEKALAANGGNAQAALMSAPKETRDYVPSVRRRLGTLGGMTAGIGDTPSPQATGFASLPGFVPKATTPKASNAPSGYRFTPSGSLEMIPGGPAEIASQARAEASAARKSADEAKAQLARNGADARQNEAAESAQSLIDSIDNLKNSKGYSTLGTLRGDFNMSIPHVRNDTKDANAQLKNVANQVVLATMSKLKALSKQGATGFGALSEKELSVLQNSIAALDQENISNEQLTKSLDAIAKTMEKVTKWKAGAEQAPPDNPSSGGLSPTEQQELDALRKRFGR